MQVTTHDGRGAIELGDDPAVLLYLAAGWQPLGTVRDGVQVLGRP